MIKQEQLFINGKEFIKTYSDSGNYIIQQPTGIKYSEAIDIVPIRFIYIETTEPIEVEKETAE